MDIFSDNIKSGDVLRAETIKTFMPFCEGAMLLAVQFRRMA